jgi:hypothetical protein
VAGVKVGEDTRVVLEILGTTLGLLAFITPAGFLAEWLQGSVGIGAAFALIFLWPCLGMLGLALYLDNRSK